MSGYISQPTEGILCIYSLQGDMTGEYMGVDLIFTKRLFYGKEKDIYRQELRLLSVVHAMMYIKKEKISSGVYINCSETIKLIESKEFSRLKITNAKLEKALRWLVFEKRLPHVFLWNENMWTPQYEILKEVT